MSGRTTNRGQGPVQKGGRPQGPGSGRSTDRRTGAGVNRLAGTTKKVTLRDNAKPEPVAKRNSGRPARSAGSGRSGGKSTGKDRTQATSSGVDKADTKEENVEASDESENIDAIREAQCVDGDTVQDSGETPQGETADDQERISSPHDANMDQAVHSNGDELAERTPSSHRPKEFDIRSFSTTMGEFSDRFSQERFTRVGDDYPIDDLISLVTEVNMAIDEYKTHTLSSQQQLEDLRDKMNNVSGSIHESVQTRTFEITQEQEPSAEQKEIAAKLARINSEVAQANIELAKLVKMSAETESAALRAAESAVEAKEAAEQIKAENEWRERKEAERKADEERKIAEERELEGKEKRRVEDDRRRKENEWKKREGGHVESKAVVWEEWSPHVYEMTADESDINIACIIRGHPAHFNERSVTCQPVSQLHSTFEFEENDELVSPILHLESTQQEDQLLEPVFVAIPFIATRSSMLGREPVVKAEMEGEWRDLYTREVTFEDHKEYRFAQAELTGFTTVAVVTRYKRDYLTLSRKTSKIVSTADHRITLTTPRGSFRDKELYMMQVQPVDSTSINDLKNRDKFMKGLLTSSPVVTTQWERTEFSNPVKITVPCPPNPAKAKKLAAMRAMKEAKMKQPLRQNAVPIDVQEKEKQKSNKKKQPDDDDYEDRPRRTETRWYMGIYGGSDDDENDNLYILHRYNNGKWAVVPDVKVEQIKLDVLQFELEAPVNRFVVLRTRTTVDENDVQVMATKLEEALSKKVVQFVLKQRVDDPFDASVHVVASGKADRVLKKLHEEGFEDGPDVSNDVTICEGDVIEIGFRGNLQSRGENPLQILYNSNMRTATEFSITEVDKYLQKNFSLFRGFIQFYRKYPIVTKPDHRAKVVQKTAEEEETSSEKEVIQYQRDLLTELLVNIPKYHIEPNTAPSRAQVTIINHNDPVNEELVRQLAIELGDEWRKVAHYLNVRRTRIQAILRNTQVGEESEDEAKYEMMMTWLKRAPKAINKVETLTTALARSGRPDLADDLRRRDEEFRQQHQPAQTCA